MSRAGGFPRSRCWHMEGPHCPLMPGTVPCGVFHVFLCILSSLKAQMFFPQTAPTFPLCICGLGDPEGFPGDGSVQQLWELLWQVQEGHFASLSSFQILSRTRDLFGLSDCVYSPSLSQLPECLYNSKIDYSPAKLLTTL